MNILVCGNKNKDLFRILFVRFHIIYRLSFHISVKYCLLHREFGFSYLPRHYLGLRLPLNTSWINQYRVFFSNVVIYACAVSLFFSIYCRLLWLLFESQLFSFHIILWQMRLLLCHLANSNLNKQRSYVEFLKAFFLRPNLIFTAQQRSQKLRYAETIGSF